MYRFQQPVSECFCAAVVEKQLRNNGLPVPPRGDDKYASVQAINDSPFLPHGAVHGLQLLFFSAIAYHAYYH